MSSFGPIDKIHQSLHAFHFPASDRTVPVPAVHYCSCDDSGFFQCLLYSSNAPDAKLIGIEYMLTEERFVKLPEEEKQLWHSHRYEIGSGQLVCLAMREKVDNHFMETKPPMLMEDEAIKKLFRTYGKTIHTWHPIDSKLPLGPPQLMMSSTAEHPDPPTKEHIAERDAMYEVDTELRHRHRGRFLDEKEKPAEGADQWQETGLAPNFEVIKQKIKD